MNEKLEISNDLDTTEYQRKKYDEFRKEIENFGDLSKSTSGRDTGKHQRLEDEIKRTDTIFIHAMSDRFHDAGLTKEQVKELEDFWRKTFYTSSEN